MFWNERNAFPDFDLLSRSIDGNKFYIGDMKIRKYRQYKRLRSQLKLISHLLFNQFFRNTVLTKRNKYKIFIIFGKTRTNDVIE